MALQLERALRYCCNIFGDLFLTMQDSVSQAVRTPSRTLSMNIHLEAVDHRSVTLKLLGKIIVLFKKVSLFFYKKMHLITQDITGFANSNNHFLFAFQLLVSATGLLNVIRANIKQVWLEFNRILNLFFAKTLLLLIHLTFKKFNNSLTQRTN